ncbi:hypothetical protein DM806_03985 [Sphingobium lactosutens]|uniref:hypothetical protein n=1 Tax=Sphingobium lactosutens TaxID=522773 RepID=UPI0015BFD1DE|nr:hypothetical protein [Sphingobium lactosutens]NWK94838.1 hypothetical protein [Sphingobium lactosutens]
MTGLPTDPSERIIDAEAPSPLPRHDPPTRMADYAATPSTDRTPLHTWAERAIQHLSRWAGPAALTGVILIIAWWLIH